jgi:uncharacterized secreted protein with C-terminal beta-propeller domain
MKKVLLKTTTFLLLVLMIFAFTGCAELFQIETTEQLPRFKNFEAMLEYMKNTGQGYMYNMRGGMPESAMAEDSAQDPSPSKGGDEGTSHGETNVQVEGIDEADVIKNDGRYLYFIAGNQLVIVDAADPSNMNVVSKILLENSASFSEMYLTGNKLTTIGYTWDEVVYTDSSSGEKDIAPGRILPGKSYVFARVYDVSNKTNPVMTREYKIEGSMLSSRVKDGKLYLITNKWAYFWYGEDVQPRAEEVLPYRYDSAVSKESTMITPNEISYVENPVDNSFMTISVMSIDNNQAVKTETVMGGGSTVYMSHNALYIVKPVFYFFPAILEVADAETSTATSEEEAAEPPRGTVTPEPEEPKTVIYKYNLTGNTVKYSGMGEVKGDVLNQFSMDEFNGNFRIATTQWTNEGTVNNVFILDSNMRNVGSVLNLAPGERIYSVRFSGNTGYVVTFRNMDPLFVLDLSNPSNPRVTGELKIPGFSNYLHPVGDGLLLGLGVDTKEIYTKDENGNEIVTGFQRGGLKLSLFDVSDPFNPKEIDTLVIGKEGSYSEAQYNHKAFTWWPEKNAAMFSAQINNSQGYKEYSSWQEGAVIVNVVNGKLSLKGILPAATDQGMYWSYYTPTRVTYINNTVYYLQMGTLMTYDYDTMLPQGQLKVVEATDYDGPYREEPMPVEPDEAPAPETDSDDDEEK